MDVRLSHPRVASACFNPQGPDQFRPLPISGSRPFGKKVYQESSARLHRLASDPDCLNSWSVDPISQGEIGQTSRHEFAWQGPARSLRNTNSIHVRFRFLRVCQQGHHIIPNQTVVNLQGGCLTVLMGSDILFSWR